VGFHLAHRQTRDLDLFWRERGELGESLAQSLAALRADGLDAHPLRTAPAFAELHVSDGSGSCVVDLVAEPFPSIEAPVEVTVEGQTIAVDTRRELLASKIATLLERSEIRDLADVRPSWIRAGTSRKGSGTRPPRTPGSLP
jgi:hypothetical protein